MPEVQLTKEWLELEKSLGYRPLIGGSVENIRKGKGDLTKMLAGQWPPADPGLKTRDEYISDAVWVRVYTPKESATSKLPVGVYAHGGGYITGDVEAEDSTYPPSAKAAWDNAEKLGGNRSKYFSIGASVGGGVALGVALKLIEVGMRSHVSGVIALTPTTCHPDYVPEEFKESFVAYDENAVGVPMIDRDSMYTMYGYAGATELKDDPFIFPILHTRKAELPAVFIVTAGADPLRDDGTIFQQALDKAGVKNKRVNYPALPHYFWNFPSIKAGDRFRDEAVEGVKFILDL